MRSTIKPLVILLTSFPILTSTDVLAQENIAEQFLYDDGTPTTMGTTADGRQRYEIRSGFAIIEGDIVLGKVKMNDGLDSPLLSRGIGRNTRIDRWTDGIVYYQQSALLDDEDRAKIAEAVDHWNTNSSLTMVERNSANENEIDDYILFEPAAGCASWVGKIGGEQAIWVGKTCTAGSVIHEIGHAAGLFHEHTRTDRDDFITVEWDNIIAGKEFNFDIMNVSASDIGPYDYDSIMHYGPRFFSANGLATIVSTDGFEIGQRVALSRNDRQSINAMYGTNLTLATSSLEENNDTLVNVSINNIGFNGAHDIELTVPLNDGASLINFSGTAWSCSQNSNEAVCTLPNIAEDAESSLALTINPGSEAFSDSQLYLTSKTYDTDFSSNGAIPADVLESLNSLGIPDGTDPLELGQAIPDVEATGGAESGGGTTGDTTTGGSTTDGGTTGNTTGTTTGGTSSGSDGTNGEATTGSATNGSTDGAPTTSGSSSTGGGSSGDSAAGSTGILALAFLGLLAGRRQKKPIS